MTTVFTELQPPPEYRGDSAEKYVRELYKWVALYHRTLEPLVRAHKQELADIAALGPLTQVVSNPPTQAEVTAIQTKVNAIIAAAAAT